VIQTIITLVIIGFVFWLIDKFIPMAEPIRTVVRVVMVIVLALWLLSAFGIWHGGPRL
jgi:hypothetical protein